MNNTYQEITLNGFEVWCVVAEGVKGSANAFNKLESALPTLRGRHFYGVLDRSPVNGIYRACVAKHFAFAPHFESPGHPETEAVGREVEHYKQTGEKYKALHDGEAIVINE